MNLNPFRRKSVDVSKTVGRGLTPKDIWDAPADFNRELRRWAGITGKVWKWNPQPGSGVPRYVRRHFSESILTAPKTRRQRRHRARILRAMSAQTGAKR